MGNRIRVSKGLTSNVRELHALPSVIDSELKCATGVTGKDEVLFMRGVNIFERDQDLDIDGFSCDAVVEEPESRLEALSISVSGFMFRFLKLSFGRRFLMDDFALDEEGPGELFSLESEGLGVNMKFTLLGVGVGVGGIFI